MADSYKKIGKGGGGGGISASLFTAKGSLIASSALGTAGELVAGTNNYVLTMDSTQTFGMKWAANATGDCSTSVSSVTDNQIARFDSTTGKIIQNSLGVINDTGVLSGLTQILMSNLVPPTDSAIDITWGDAAHPCTTGVFGCVYGRMTFQSTGSGDEMVCYGGDFSSNGITSNGIGECYRARVSAHASDTSGSRLYGYAAQYSTAAGSATKIAFGAYSNSTAWDYFGHTMNQSMKFYAQTSAIGDTYHIELDGSDGTTKGDVKLACNRGNVITSNVLPVTAATYALGSTTYPFKAIYLDQTSTDGGAVYFNASSTAFLKSDAAGSYLQMGGFQDFRPTAQFCDLGQGALAGGAWEYLYLGSRYDTSTGIYFDAENYLTYNTPAILHSCRWTNNITELEFGGADRVKVTDELVAPTLFTLPPIPADGSELHWLMDDATPDTAIVSSGTAAISLSKVGSGTIAAKSDFLGNSTGKGARLTGANGWYNVAALAGRTINTKDFILEMDFHFEATGGYNYVFSLWNASNKQLALEFNGGIWYLFDTLSGSTRFAFFSMPFALPIGYHRFQLKFDRSNGSLSTITMDGVNCPISRCDFTDTSAEDWDYEGLNIGGSTRTGGGVKCSFSNYKILIGSVDGTMPTSTTVFEPRVLSPKTSETHSIGAVNRAIKDITLDAGSSHGGQINFNAGTTSYIQSSNDGATLALAGFTLFSAGNSEFKIKTYSQNGEPTLLEDGNCCFWKDTDDSNKIYLVYRRGSGDQVKIQLT